MNYSSDEDDKPLIFRSVSDSEDDKPLSSKISTVSKVNTNQAKKGSHKSVSTAPKPQIKVEDSDDEKPLSSKLIYKPNVGSANKAHQNGSASRDNQPKNIGVNKRPLGEESPGQSSVKKPKLSDSSTPVNRKPVNLKVQTKSDDVDDLSIEQKIKNQASASSKPSSSKQKVIKKSSSSLNQTNKKSKKVAKTCPIVMLERIQKKLEDVIMSNRQLTQNITELTEKVANICKTQAELQEAIDAITLTVCPTMSFTATRDQLIPGQVPLQCEPSVF